MIGNLLLLLNLFVRQNQIKNYCKIESSTAAKRAFPLNWPITSRYKCFLTALFGKKPKKIKDLYNFNPKELPSLKNGK